ncbi:LacI family DNA-binding transcriptional regulator [Zavarzinella formosa]|uniref:LacI family DNA-binding transcriptional regulator n=1 Tax=Zavarzinella formosa TaxID=360055 RepID=UPI0003103C1C|nr:LacI family DNA-binding transcriptional regulator [Zavarzinella formosa]
MTPDTRPKYLLIAETIESRIKRGEWVSGRFPSVRDVAEEHAVSIVTASRALQVLRDKGIIRTVERSGCFVEASANGVTTQFALCQRISPGPWHNATAAIMLGGFAAAAEHVGSTLDTEHYCFGPDASPREVERLAKQARVQKIAGVFMLPSRVSEATASQDETFVAACRKESIPVVLLERNLRGHSRLLQHDLVSGDDLAGGLAMTDHLVKQGCHRIAFVTGSPTSSHDARLAGYLLGMHQAGMPSYVLTQNSELPARQAYHQLVEQILRLRADGVICYQDYTAIGVIMELMSRGLTVPGDVAVAGFDDLPIGDAFAIGVTTYKLPAEGIAREAFKLIERRIELPHAPVIQVTTPGRLIVRESTSRIKL